MELLERQPEIDWDVIIVRVSDSQIAQNADLMMQIIRQYGRTCRRYRFEVMTTLQLYINAGWNDGELICYYAGEYIGGENGWTGNMSVSRPVMESMITPCLAQNCRYYL